MPKDRYAYKKITVYFTDIEVLRRMQKYVMIKYGHHRGTSVVVEEAVRDYLDRKGG